MQELSKLQSSVKDALQSHSKTQAGAAKEIGISPAAFNEWLKGRYRGDNEKVEESIQNWLKDLGIREAFKTSIKRQKSFLETDTSRLFRTVFENAKSGPDIGLITGAAGVGKTCTANHYAENTPNVWVMTADPSIKSPRAALREVGEIVGVARSAGSSLLRGLVRRLRDTQGLLIVDEAQHLSSEAIDQLRALHDQAEIGMVFMGNSPLKDRIEGYARLPSHAQLFSRIGFRADVKTPRKNDIYLLLNGWGLESEDLEKVCEKMAYYPGALRLMEKILRYAGTTATRSSREAISLDDLKGAWKDLTASAFPKIGSANA